MERSFIDYFGKKEERMNEKLNFLIDFKQTFSFKQDLL